jgi:hypothetical protein
MSSFPEIYQIAKEVPENKVGSQGRRAIASTMIGGLKNV